MARPRSQEAHERVLLTALDLFGTRGIDATSMDAVAHASGVSKATIYNHWANKEALLLDVMLMLHGLNRDAEEVDSGDICRDLATVLSRRPPDRFDAARDRIMPALVAYSAVHREFGDAWRHRVMEPGRQCLKGILRRGIARKQLPGSLDLDDAMALLLGPLLYMKIFQNGACSEDIGAKVAAAFWRAHGTARSAPAPAKAKRSSAK